MSAVLILPWPVAALWQNSRAHWRTRASATKKARTDATVIAQCCGLRRGDWESAHFEWAFIPPDNRRRDLSNAIGATKAAIDGVADALGINDGTFTHSWPMRFEAPAKGGAIRVTVTPVRKAVAA